MTTQGPITIYNRRLGADRRDVYWPTLIPAASYSEALGSSHSNKETSDGHQYKLRIPLSAAHGMAREYISAEAYQSLTEEQAAGCWTISMLDLVTRGATLVDGPASERDIREAAAIAGLDVIIIEEYADNTGRGSPAVRHWRIKGR